jgi:apolipoprotein N-acyltransferase
LLLGGKTYAGDREKPDAIFQTAMLIDRDERIVGRYQKRHLMPFGEYVPGSGWVPGIGNLFSIEEEVSPGDAATVLYAEHGARIGAMLCYEDMVPSAARTLTNERANLLISLINGAAFTNPLTLAQHRLLAQLRAVECRRSLLRCSSTGETCVISPLGQIEDSLTPQTQAVLCTAVPLLETRSLYCRLGDFFPILACVALVAMGIQKRRMMRGRPTLPGPVVQSGPSFSGRGSEGSRFCAVTRPQPTRPATG